MIRVHEQIITPAELAAIEAEESQFDEWQHDAAPQTVVSWGARAPAKALCGTCHGSGIVEATGRLCVVCKATGDVPQRRSDRIRSTWGVRK